MLTRESWQSRFESPLKVTNHEFIKMPICLAYLIYADEKKGQN